MEILTESKVFELWETRRGTKLIEDVVVALVLRLWGENYELMGGEEVAAFFSQPSG